LLLLELLTSEKRNPNSGDANLRAIRVDIPSAAWPGLPLCGASPDVLELLERDPFGRRWGDFNSGPVP
jgi:hypothetical protein